MSGNQTWPLVLAATLAAGAMTLAGWGCRDDSPKPAPSATTPAPVRPAEPLSTTPAPQPAEATAAASGTRPAPAVAAPAGAVRQPGPAPLAQPETIAPRRVVRRPRLAGSWYEGDAQRLRDSIEGYLQAAQEADRPPLLGPVVVGLVVPHAGHRFSGPTAAFAYGRLRTAPVRRVFVLGTDHRAGIHGIGLPAQTHFASPLGEIPVDTEEVRALSRHPLFFTSEDAHAEEHSVEVQLPFVQVVAPAATLVPLVVGRLTLEEVGRASRHLRARLRAGDVLIVASDFTHYGPSYGYVPFAASQAASRLEELARGAWEPLVAGKLEPFWRHKYDTGDTICGFFPTALLLAVLDGRVKGTFEHFDTSGRIGGDYSNSVSYVAATFAGAGPEVLAAAAAECRLPAVCPPAGGLAPSEQVAAVRMAREAAETWVRTGSAPRDVPARYELTERLRANGAVFVTLKKHGELRGCIGSILASRPLWEDIVDHAGNAALRDGRFPPVTADEIPDLEVEVSVLSPPKEVAGAGDILVGRDGIVVQKDGRRAVFLPQVPIEQGWDLPRTLAHLSQKAGLPHDAWRDGMTFEIFQAQVFGEPIE